MKKEYTVKQDGKTYLPGEEIPDLGSITCVESRGMIRSYEGLSKDVDKLPKYVESGSSCLMVDTGDYYKYEKYTETWYKV